MVKRQRPKTEKELAYQARRKAQAKRELDAWLKHELEKAPPLTPERWKRIKAAIETIRFNRIVRFYHTSAKPPKLAQGRLKS